MKLRQCDCGSDDVEVVQSFATFFAMCHRCGAASKEYPTSTKVNGMWPREAAGRAWNDGIMEGEGL